MTDPSPDLNSHLKYHLSSQYDHNYPIFELDLITLMKLRCHQGLLIGLHLGLIVRFDFHQFLYQSVIP